MGVPYAHQLLLAKSSKLLYDFFLGVAPGVDFHIPFHLRSEFSKHRLLARDGIAQMPFKAIVSRLYSSAFDDNDSLEYV
jgi:hypothetical protein